MVYHYYDALFKVREIGKIIEKMRGKTLITCSLRDVDEGRGTLSTNADKIALEKLVEFFKENYKDYGIIAEGLDKYLQNLELNEGVHPSKNNLYWVIDPLCGTLFHARGIGDYIVSVALVNQNLDILFGCVYFPPQDDMFHAIKENGAYLNGERIRGVSDTSSLEKAIISIEHKIIRENAPQIQPLSRKITRQRMGGTCGLEMCYVADGRLDALLKSKQPLYDYAAGLVILREVEAKVTDFEGNPIYMELNRRKCTNLVCSNGKIHDELIGYTKSFV